MYSLTISMKMYTHTKHEGTRYYGEVSNVRIEVKHTTVLVPNLFTQKNDGTQCFEIKGLEQMADHNLRIVNRWGQEVFKARKYKNNWIPKELSAGNYYYLLHIKATVKDEWQAFKGYITIVNAEK